MRSNIKELKNWDTWLLQKASGIGYISIGLGIMLLTDQNPDNNPTGIMALIVGLLVSQGFDKFVRYHQTQNSVEKGVITKIGWWGICCWRKNKDVEQLSDEEKQESPLLGKIIVVF